MFILIGLRINLGISDLFAYIVFGNFQEVLERLLMVIPSMIIMGKIIPPGVEASMFALTSTLISVSLYVLRI